jgi:hypothetical protein
MTHADGHGYDLPVRSQSSERSFSSSNSFRAAKIAASSGDQAGRYCGAPKRHAPCLNESRILLENQRAAGHTQGGREVLLVLRPVLQLY